MTTYYYPPVIGGYLWNLIQRVTNTLGVAPVGVGTTSLDSTVQTYLTFDAPLVVAQKLALDAIMADNPTQPPTPIGPRLIIKDIWETRSAFKTAIGGFDFAIYISESTLGSGLFDQIELHFATSLTTAQRNKVLAEFGKLIS